MIAVDICNTCANLQVLLAQRFGSYTTYPLPVQEDFWTSSEAMDLYTQAKPLNNAAPFFTELALKFNGVTYVTNRPIQSEFTTHRWLRKHGFPSGKIMFCKRDQKAEVYLSLNPVIIAEDDPKVAVQVAESGIPVLMFHWPYNSFVLHKRIHKVDNEWYKEAIWYEETR